MGAYTRRDKAEMAADFERVFGLFPRLKERHKQVAGTMSGGEQQMLAIGRALMAAAETWLAQRGIPKVQLMVRATNASVVAFYERLGYDDQECLVLGKFFDDSLAGARAAAH